MLKLLRKERSKSGRYSIIAKKTYNGFEYKIPSFQVCWRKDGVCDPHSRATIPARRITQSQA
jgi:hypothetical protein